MKRLYIYTFLLFYILLFFITACQDSGDSSSPTTAVFQKINSTHSGIVFSNTLTPDVTTKNNLLDFDFFYNGAGVGVADINNDGLTDIFFVANQTDNKLYLNKGNLQFEDISDKAGININKQWSNGVSFTDVNQDGWLDIYVAQGGPSENRANLLFINQQDLTFKESAAAYGLADTGISTQSAFFDYDKDGDLDCVVMNENPLYGMDPVSFYTTIGTQEGLLHKSCSHLYRNDDGQFTDVTEAAGLLQPSFGLGLVVSDINNDNWLDIYIANDYYLPDALYINKRNGTFTDEIKNKTKQISFYGMGADIADINNDGNQDIFVLDMATQDHYRAKTLMASMSTANFNMLVNRFRFPYQYMYNTLQLNIGNDQFKNIAHYAGLAKTDWSWAGLMVDLNNNGQKEIFVTNGYRKYALDNDFKNKVEAAKRQYKGAVPNQVKQTLYDQMPTEKLPNLLYANIGDMRFKDQANQWGLGEATYSNGAAYADLDNDGDLELIVNNMDATASLYKNTSIENGIGNYLRIKTKVNFAKVTLIYDGHIQFSEAKTVRGYLSAVEPTVHFGLGMQDVIDTVRIEWPDGSRTEQYQVTANQELTIEKESTAAIAAKPTSPHALVKQVSIGQLKLAFRHKENIFNDFEKEILLPYKQSTIGPCISKGDLNGDGLTDLFIGGASGQAGAIFIQTGDQLKKLTSPALQQDAVHEDMEALFFDYDADGDQDLYIVSGGNAFPINSEQYQDRIYLNDGQGNLTKASVAILVKYKLSGKSICAIDYDKDGDTDLIIGNRIVPQNYPKAAPSLILENEGGQLKEVTLSVAPELANFGIVNKVISTDFNNDGWEDFIAVGEWSGIGLFENKEGIFENVAPLSDLQERGWWFTVAETDVNKDGLTDYLIGNLGQNSKFKASIKEPFKVFATDFDDNGTNDIVLSNPYNGEYVPSRGRECSSQQMPFIAEKFPTYDAFAKASLSDIYGEKLDSAVAYEANTFESILLLNQGASIFKKIALPPAAQTAPILSIAIQDVNKDGFEDAIIAGTIYNTEVETPRWDSGSGQVLLSNGKNGYASIQSPTGLYIDGNVKDLEVISIDGKNYLIAARNNNLLAVYQFLK